MLQGCSLIGPDDCFSPTNEILKNTTASAESTEKSFKIKKIQSKNLKFYRTGDFLPKSFVAIHSFPLSNQNQKQFQKIKMEKRKPFDIYCRYKY